MSIGTILLILAGILLLMGIGQRVLDKLGLRDWQALLAIALTVALGFVPDVPVTESFSFNVGGALIPLALSVWLFIRAGGKEKLRCIAALTLSAVAIYFMGRLLPDEPEEMFFDATYLYGAAAGVIAWIFGKSRRGAFIAGSVGTMLAETAGALLLQARGISQHLSLGGAGGYDVIILSGLLAVLTCELIGEIAERIKRGAKEETK